VLEATVQLERLLRKIMPLPDFTYGETFTATRVR
jgi:hypothetical protein